MYSALVRDRFGMSRCRRSLLVLLLATAASLVASGSASAYVTAGQLFPPTNTCAADTFLQTGVAPGSNGYTIPGYGAITSWNFWTGAEPVPGLTLKVARPIGNGAFTIAGEAIAGTQHPNLINTFKTNLLVEPGEVIGIYTSGGSSQNCGSVFTEPFDTYVFAEGNWPTESTTIFQSPPPEGSAPYSLFPVAANISEPPTSALQVPPCSGVGFAAFIGTDYGTAPKGVHYIIDGETEGFAKANSEGYATIKPATIGTHTIEYWAEDKATDLERVRHLASVFVVKQGPKVVMTSEQNTSDYGVGQKGSISIKASSPYGLALDPSATHVPIETGTPGFFTAPAAAVDNCGNTTKETFQYTVSPADHKLVVAKPVFAAAKSGASTARVSTGTTIDYTSTGQGVTRFTISKKTAGIEEEGECEKPHKRHQRGKRCTFFELMQGDFVHENESGANSFRFTGRLNGRMLAPGIYRLTATPEYESIYGQALKRKFRIVK